MGSLEHFKPRCGMDTPVTIMCHITNYPKLSGLAQPFRYDHRFCGSGKWTNHAEALAPLRLEVQLRRLKRLERLLARGFTSERILRSGA